ncbi:MAG: peptidase S41, partial [Muribaculaceae bacterium]|nr:peptidase S41 [Muribaculaceae bacterium]
MRHLSETIALAIALAMLAACHKVDSYKGGLYGNVEALWTIVDEHYCCFEEKDGDWQQIRER